MPTTPEVNERPAVRFIDEWLDRYAPYLPGHVIDFALDVRRLVEAPELFADEESDTPTSS